MDSASRTVERTRGVKPYPGTKRCAVCGDSDRLVADMMTFLRCMSDTAYDALTDSYKNVFQVLIDSKVAWDEKMADATAGSRETAPEDTSLSAPTARC